MQSDRHAKGYEDRDKDRNQIAIEKQSGNPRHRVPTGLAGHGGLSDALGLAETGRNRDGELHGKGVARLIACDKIRQCLSIARTTLS